MGDTNKKTLDVTDYLQVGDVGALTRVCNLLDALAKGAAEHGGRFKGAIVSAAYTTVADGLRKQALPELIEAGEKKSGQS